MSVLTSRYARAFVDTVIHDPNQASQTSQQLDTIATTVRSSLELRRVWESPAIPAKDKLKLLDAIVRREGISRLVRNFIAVLIDHRRITLLDLIRHDFRQELDRRLGFAEAEITTARELGEAERHDLELQVERLTGKKVRAGYSRDHSILGGAIVRLGSTIYDGSVKGQLERIREQLAS